MCAANEMTVRQRSSGKSWKMKQQAPRRKKKKEYDAKEDANNGMDRMHFKIPGLLYAALSRFLRGVSASDEPFPLRSMGDSLRTEYLALRSLRTDNKRGDLR